MRQRSVRLVGVRASLLRPAYRIAAPLAGLWWDLWRIDHSGSKCVLSHDGAVLLVRHTYGDRGAWDFPGGFSRRGEAPAATARREIGEELGLVGGVVGELRPLGDLFISFRRRTDTVHYFAATLADRSVAADPGEIAEVGWFAPDALPASLGRHVRQVLASIEPAEALASVASDPGSPDRG
jgi:8-oxo-dGTP pyrophosphatase MutT (NUDIX family)